VHGLIVYLIASDLDRLKNLAETEIPQN